MAVNQVSSVRSDIAEMLTKIREFPNKSKVFTPKDVQGEHDFGNIFTTAKEAINKINSLQMAAEQVKDAYATGSEGITMAQVVLASQKSKLAMEGLVTVRNKILESYKEIMNMPV